MRITEKELYQAYLEANHDEEREKELKEWDAFALEGWDEPWDEEEPVT